EPSTMTCPPFGNFALGARVITRLVLFDASAVTETTASGCRIVWRVPLTFLTHVQATWEFWGVSSVVEFMAVLNWNWSATTGVPDGLPVLVCLVETSTTLLPTIVGADDGLGDGVGPVVGDGVGVGVGAGGFFPSRMSLAITRSLEMRLN